jgi:hypothetical protein
MCHFPCNTFKYNKSLTFPSKLNPTPFYLFKSIDSLPSQPPSLKPPLLSTIMSNLSYPFQFMNLHQHTQFPLKHTSLNNGYSLISCPKFTLHFLPFLSPPTLHPYAFNSLWPKSHTQIVLQLKTKMLHVQDMVCTPTSQVLTHCTHTSQFKEE